MLALASSGWLILLLFFFFTVMVGAFRKEKPASGEAFLFAGQAMPGWLCAVGFAMGGLGALDLLAMGAAGARYGLDAAWFALGSVAAMLFAGLELLPRYRAAKVHSVPEYLGLRFGRNVRLASALLLIAVTVASTAFSLLLAARIARSLHIADTLFYTFGWPLGGIFTTTLLVTVGVAALSVLLSGLAGSTINQTVQFFMLWAGMLPAVCAGLKSIGGWSGLQAALPAALASIAPATPHLPGLLLTAGLVLGAGFWCVDLRPLQMALAAKNNRSAHRTVLFAAPLRLALAALAILAGAIALATPTPQSSTSEREVNGVIYHQTTVVPRELALGEGLVPAHLAPPAQAPLRHADGRPVLDFALATPYLLGKFLPLNLLGLGVAALLAALLSGLTASFSALATLAVHDVYAPLRTTPAAKPEPQKTLAWARWATVACALLVAALAWFAEHFSAFASNDALSVLFLLLGLATPLFATVLLAGFARRVHGRAAWTGLAAGELAALLHFGLTLPGGADSGLAGGWIAVLYRYPDALEQCLAAALVALTANVLIAGTMSCGGMTKQAATQPGRRAKK